MADLQYRTTFWTGTFLLEGQLPVDEFVDSSTSTRSREDPANANQPGPEGFASFICHVSYLEKSLRAEDSIFFDTDSERVGKPEVIGQGTSFRVERVRWRTNSPSEAAGKRQTQKPEFVALKRVLGASETGWGSILLEIRALLHEPFRYHPNIVGLLGLGWGPTMDTDSIYPVLAVQYAALGSMRALQEASDQLCFAVKQKLCYDVARGLSMLHACGVVHSDLKHENVLIFENRLDMPDLPYTAKLADFGGSFMDIAEGEARPLRMGTWPFTAPEFGAPLSIDQLKQSDVYSFGLLVWRTIVDCENIIAAAGLSSLSSQSGRNEFENLKSSNELVVRAKISIENYALRHNLPPESAALILYILDCTIQAAPSSRGLPKAQAALRGLELELIERFLEVVDWKNKQRIEADKTTPPGKHGASLASIAYFYGRTERMEFDEQANIPGNQPNLSHPAAGEYLFEPHKLRRILNWSQQVQMVGDFERAAASGSGRSASDIQPWAAAFFVFQCYCFEFGVVYNAEKLCDWLSKATTPKIAGGVNYHAQAWLWRTVFSVIQSIQSDARD